MPTSIDPQTEAQAFLQGLVSSDTQEFLAVKTKEELKEKMITFSSLMSGDKAAMMRQLLYFRRTCPDGRVRAIVGILVRELSLSKEDIALGLLPVLEQENTDDVSTAENWLGEVHVGTGQRRIDFSIYSQLLGQKKISAAPGFARFLYRVSLADGVECLSQHYLPDQRERRTVQEKVKGGTVADLESLVNQDRWWLDLYVAEVLSKDPSKREDGLLRRLQSSKRPYVRNAIRAFQPQEPLP